MDRWRLCELQIRLRLAIPEAYERKSPRPIVLKLAFADRLIGQALDGACDADAEAAAERALASWIAHCRATAVRRRFLQTLHPPQHTTARSAVVTVARPATASGGRFRML